MKNIVLILFLYFSFISNSYSAGSSGGETKSKYDQAVKLINAAKKNEEKGKQNKAEKRRTAAEAGKEGGEEKGAK